ncbi:hypothetical protein HOM50_04405 [bacterium]|nr:hypothetical protein [bacterium]MBT5015621.1 hypothetical protein [bacterium]
MKKLNLIFIALLISYSSISLLHAKEMNSEESETISFDIQHEKLMDIIVRLSAKRNINIIFPEKQDGLQVKVFFPLAERISPQRAWEFLETFLNMSGFIITPHAEDFIIVPSKEIDITPLPLWGGNFSPSTLPDNDEPIRYIYSFVNINIAENNSTKANLQSIFKDMLPGSDSKALFDAKSNSVLITGSASKIKGVMNIVQELDITGFRESIEVLPLRHAQASVVVQIINKLIPDAEGNRFYPMPQQTQRTTFFSKNTRVVSIPSSNSVAIMGKVESVDRVSKFIHKYLDSEPKTNKNILHIKHLNNLNAEEFAPELVNLIKHKMPGDQSTGKSKDDLLSGVIIVAQKADQSSSQQAKLKETAIGKQIGGSVDLTQEKLAGSSGNNLVIAAKERDWKMIESIIDQLDRPQLQVAFEVLIAEITLSDLKELEAQIRGSQAVCDPPPVAKWQSSQITTPVLNYEKDSSGAYTDTLDSAQGIDSNLLPVPAGDTTHPGLTNIASIASAGQTILSYKSTNGILGILQMISQYKRSTILSQPFLVTSNHQQASIDLVTEKLANGSADTASTGGPITVNSQKLDAALSVALYPHISISNSINLQILVQANEFLDGSSTRTIRAITTNANIEDKEVLVLGGLTQVTTENTQSGTPVLSSIPIVGNLFKKRTKDYDRSVLLIFISPTIIRPLLSGGVNSFTQTKTSALKGEILSAGENFESMNNPVSRIVFPYAHYMPENFNNSIDLFVNQGSYDSGGQSALAKKVENKALKKMAAADQAEFEKEHKQQLVAEEKALEHKALTRAKNNKKKTKKTRKSQSLKERQLKKKLKNKKNPFDKKKK